MRGSQQEGTRESTGGEPIYGQRCLFRLGARLQSDQRSTVLVLFLVVIFEWVSFFLGHFRSFF